MDQFLKNGEFIASVAIVLGALHSVLFGVRKALLTFKDKTETKVDDEAFVVVDKILWFIDMIGMNPDHADATVASAKTVKVEVIKNG